MPTTRIEIENYNNVWIAEVELGGISARVTRLKADDFDTLLVQLLETIPAEMRAPYIAPAYVSAAATPEMNAPMNAFLKKRDHWKRIRKMVRDHGGEWNGNTADGVKYLESVGVSI